MNLFMARGAWYNTKDTTRRALFMSNIFKLLYKWRIGFHR